MTGIIGAVSPGEAAAVQEQYLRLLEQLLQLTAQDTDLSEKKSGVQIFDGERLIAEYPDREPQSEQVNSDLTSQMVQLSTTPVGGVVEGANNKKVEVDGRVVMQSNNNGQVTVNKLLEFEDLAKSFAGTIAPPNSQPKPSIKSKTPQQMAEIATEIIQNRTSSSPEQNNSKNVSYEGFLDNAEIAAFQQPIEQQQVERGSDIVNRSLAQLPESNTKRLADSYTQEIQSLLRLLQNQERQINQLQTSVGELTIQLKQQRLSQPENKSWWSQAKTTLLNNWNNWKQFQQQHQAASVIRQLYTQQTFGNNKVLQLAEYRIERSGKNYTLSDHSGQVIMQFSSTSLGVRVDTQNTKLSSKNYQDIERLKIQQSRREQPDGAFSHPGADLATSEIEYYIRARKIASRLLEYATRKGQNITLDGQFSYKWKASVDGEVQIYAKDGRGLILAQVGDKILCRMSDRDLGYFEKALEKIRSQETSHDNTLFSSSHKKHGLER
ncbi:hypothetical protein [Floridanema evergladense]|uniref:Uncharacterized protein n=1 Tax=Floridaenema evergladense BLCC-F167 TaxID=3153639 RepID=A0ABV4WSE5_9CYAN